eukprot:5730-Heterococcus_DN1.PRE.9
MQSAQGKGSYCTVSDYEQHVKGALCNSECCIIACCATTAKVYRRNRILCHEYVNKCESYNKYKSVFE